MLTKPTTLLTAFLLGCACLHVQAAVLTVTSLDDSGAGTLRLAITNAASGDTIRFDAALNGGTITLTSGELTITNNLTIEGPGPDLLTIDGNNNSRIFTPTSYTNSQSSITVNISGLFLTRGSAVSGGAIASLTTSETRFIYLTVSNCVISSSQSTGAVGDTTGAGGGLYAARNTFLTAVDSEFVGSMANSSGGGIWLYSDSTIERCSFVGNIAKRSGGGIHARHSGLVRIRNCTFSQNEACSSLQSHQDGGGGGLSTEEKPKVSVYNSTFTLNHAAGNNTDKHRGGGLYVRGIADATHYVSLNSTLVASNTSNFAFPDVYVFGDVLATNCLIQVTNGVSIVGSGNIFGQPAELEALADNGGLTRTHALTKDSPAIDMGLNPLGLGTDQRGTGFARQVGPGVDIGAFEYTSASRGTAIWIQ